MDSVPSLGSFVDCTGKPFREIYTYCMDRLADADTHPILLQKCLIVVGTFPPVEVKQEAVDAAIVNTLNYLIKEARVWNKAVRGEESRMNSMEQQMEDMALQNKMMEDRMRAMADPSAMYGPQGGKKPKEKAKPKKVDQSAEVIMLRRQLHQLLENVRVSFDGVRFGKTVAEPKLGFVPLNAQGKNASLTMTIAPAIAELQNALNNDTISRKADLGKVVSDQYKALIEAAQGYPGVEGVSQNELEDELAEMANAEGEEGEEAMIDVEANPDAPSEEPAPADAPETPEPSDDALTDQIQYVTPIDFGLPALPPHRLICRYAKYNVAMLASRMATFLLRSSIRHLVST